VSKVVTRRDFLNLLGATSSAAVVLQVTTALGLLPASASAGVPVIAAPKNGRSIVILGAGIAGLTAAYELERAGYGCTVLEASHRPGGRVFTIRSGDFIDEMGNPQYCEFDDEPHMYFNAGAARIPGSHRKILHYCRELGVEMEHFINENKNAYIQDDDILGGRRIRNREFTTNARGFMAELMSKSISREDLDQPFTNGEAEKVLSMIQSFGDLDSSFRFKGSTRAGYKSGGFLDHSVQKEMLAFKDLLHSDYLRHNLSANEGETGPVLLQPVGGMDKIIEGFTRKIGRTIKYKAAVTSVMVKEQGVEVGFEQDGKRQIIKADYCFNSIPTHLMLGVVNNFSPDYVSAMKSVRRGEAYKAAFQARERFWEAEDIYGGISWTNQPIRQIWYPPHGIFKQKGVILGAYDYGGGMHFTRMTQQERLEAHITQGEKLHPNYRQMVEKGVTIAWHRMNHMLGCSARWGKMTGDREKMYRALQRPEAGRHYFIGDQVSMHPAWQESAVYSAHWALSDMDARVRAGLHRDRAGV
jgi:monoamine oxidase